MILSDEHDFNNKYYKQVPDIKYYRTVQDECINDKEKLVHGSENFFRNYYGKNCEALLIQKQFTYNIEYNFERNRSISTSSIN